MKQKTNFPLKPIQLSITAKCKLKPNRISTWD